MASRDLSPDPIVRAQNTEEQMPDYFKRFSYRQMVNECARFGIDFRKVLKDRTEGLSQTDRATYFSACGFSARHVQDFESDLSR